MGDREKKKSFQRSKKATPGYKRSFQVEVEQDGMEIDSSVSVQSIPRRSQTEKVTVRKVRIQQKIDYQELRAFKNVLSSAHIVTPESLSGMQFKEFATDHTDEFDDIDQDPIKDRLIFFDEPDEAHLLKLYCIVNELFVFPYYVMASRRDRDPTVDEYRVSVKINRNVESALSSRLL